MDSVFVNPGIYIYSCAVDTFLEISTHLFLPCVSNLRIISGLASADTNDPCALLQTTWFYVSLYFSAKEAERIKV